MFPFTTKKKSVVAFHRALTAILGTLEDSWEILYVDDGSRDSSLSLLLRPQEHDPRITVVELSRNFGHQPALSAGLIVAGGDAVVLMDFQDPPEVVPQLVEAWKSDAKVVVAKRSRRAEKWLRGNLCSFFYKMLGLISDFPIPLNAGIFRLLDRPAADAINNLQECNRYLPGLRAWIGFPTVVVSYQRAERPSKPKQTFLRLFLCDGRHFQLQLQAAAGRTDAGSIDVPIRGCPGVATGGQRAVQMEADCPGRPGQRQFFFSSSRWAGFSSSRWVC